MEKKEKLPTRYAPAERSSVEEIELQKEHLRENKSVLDIINLIPEMILILNKNRQAIFANNALLKRFGILDGTEIIGKRFGEIIECVRAFETEGGCGTTEVCRFCGDVNSFLFCQKYQCEIQEECRIIKKDTLEALDLRVSASQLIIGQEQFIMCTVIDTSDEKRRRMLERIFFHDVLNTAGNIIGFTELLESESNEEMHIYRKTILELSKKLIEEIDSQRTLTAAENNELSVSLSELNSFEIIMEVVDSYKRYNKSKGIKIEAENISESFRFISDRILLRRVLGNMLKNALEATPEGGTVKIGCRVEESKLIFHVHNQTYIPNDVQLQIFQRSFSTKGMGRGLGTYSMKLLGERYLGGEVGFFSSKNEGTIFFINLPLNNPFNLEKNIF